MMESSISKQIATISSQLEDISSQGLRIQDSPFQILTTLGTLGAVFVALFATFWPNIVACWKRPKLVFKFGNDEPFCRRVPNILDPKTGKVSRLNSYYVRLRVKNTGLSIARNCEGKLVVIAHKDLKTLLQDFDPVVLRWVGNYNSSGLLDINSQEYEYLDVFSTNEKSDRLHIAAIDYSIPRGITMDPQRDDYFVLITIHSENADLVSKICKITSGSIYDDVKLTIANRSEQEKFYKLL